MHTVKVESTGTNKGTLHFCTTAIYGYNGKLTIKIMVHSSQHSWQDAHLKYIIKIYEAVMVLSFVYIKNRGINAPSYTGNTGYCGFMWQF